jgi:hypothetical protein
MSGNRAAIAAVALAAWFAACTPASADITAFVGLSGGPTVRNGWGLAAGLGLAIVGIEFEYADVSESLADGAPRTRTVVGNLLVQTPVPIGGVQLYGTVGAGGYHQDLGVATETNACVNVGGGVKIRLAGPLRLRVDYRVFRWMGAPFGADTSQRVYVGANLSF